MPLTLSRNESGRLGALKSDSTHHFFRNACTKSDTDSVVYTSRPGEWKPELGDYQRDLTDEVPDNKIIEFVTGEPRNYACKIARPARMVVDIS
jgi:hypothetical protein